MTQLMNSWQEWAISAGILMGAVVLALVAHKILFSAGKRLAKRTGSVIENSLVEHESRSAMLPADGPSLQRTSQGFDNRIGIGRSQR